MSWYNSWIDTSNTSPKKLILPKPDAYENYWLNGKTGPVIFKAGKSIGLQRLGRPKDGDYWFVSLGVSEGPFMENTDKGKKLKYFPNPQEALESLKELLCNGK